MAEKKKVRIGLGTFDLIKGIAIFLVIISHVQPRFPLNELPFLAPLVCLESILGPGLMPMFFIMSGYGHREKKAGAMLSKSFSELIIPYLCAIPIYLCAHFVLLWPVYECMKDRLVNIGVRFLGFLLGLPVEKDIFGHHVWATSALWFFLALFIAENLLNLIIKIKNQYLQFLGVALCIGIGFLLLSVDFNYYCIPQGLHATAYCYLGYLLKKHKLVEQGLHLKWVYIILGSIVVIQTIWATYSDQWFAMAAGDYNILKYIAAGLNGMFFLYVGVWCDRLEWKWLELFRKMGMYSYWIIIVHSLETLSFPWYELDLENPVPLLAFSIEITLKTIIIISGCVILKRLSQSKYRRKVVKNGEQRIHR